MLVQFMQRPDPVLSSLQLALNSEVRKAVKQRWTDHLNAIDGPGHQLRQDPDTTTQSAGARLGLRLEKIGFCNSILCCVFGSNGTCIGTSLLKSQDGTLLMRW